MCTHTVHMKQILWTVRGPGWSTPSFTQSSFMLACQTHGNEASWREVGGNMAVLGLLPLCHWGRGVPVTFLDCKMWGHSAGEGALDNQPQGSGPFRKRGIANQVFKQSKTWFSFSQQPFAVFYIDLHSNPLLTLWSNRKLFGLIVKEILSSLPHHLQVLMVCPKYLQVDFIRENVNPWMSVWDGSMSRRMSPEWVGIILIQSKLWMTACRERQQGAPPRGISSYYCSLW